jgi:hypothetical protein
VYHSYDAGRNRNYLAVATVVTRNANEVMLASTMGSGGACFWREPGVTSQAVGFFYVCSMELTSVALKTFSHLI